ncbi:MAG: tyrosine-type recombinase/integrase [Devosia sp.]|uniref:tyrosine-type recombinase/integrase n=1 Tax=Devosia sp. TaxID=1871048 RepID=UPI0019F960AE|nr:tyrosine-type recombinase/integrase [Devosia sp.]MBF0678558.1 tyrosine-type recombinase/integrase [Devosia sp.]
MAKTLKEAPITTRNARKELPQGIHWRGIDPEVHLGYRKGARGGVWLVRWRNGVGYKQMKLGTADDEIAVGTLDFQAATKAGRETVQRERLDAKALADGPILTVQSAVEQYIAMRDNRDSKWAGRSVRSDASSRLRRYVLGAPASSKKAAVAPSPLAAIPLHRLTEPDLRAWCAGLPNNLKHATLLRLGSDLKAALNSAYDANRERLNPRLPDIIKRGIRFEHLGDHREPAARENQILADADVARLLKAAREIDAEQYWEGDLYRMVLVLTATGARFSQVARMQVKDCQRKEGRLIVPRSRKGQGDKSDSLKIPVGQDVLDELVPVTQGRDPYEPLLERWRHAQAPGGRAWVRSERGRWQSAAALDKSWQQITARAGLPKVIPYALRHTSIVNGIRANQPIRLVAALHDTSVVQIEKHYSRWIVDGLEEIARAAVRPLVPQTEGAKIIKFN